MDPQTPAMSTGEIRIAVLAVVGVVCARLGLDSAVVPSVAFLATALVMGVWSRLEKRAALKDKERLVKLVEAAKVAIPTALALPSGSGVATLIKTLAVSPAPPIAFIPVIEPVGKK
jgi:hypothetical protein